MSFKNFHSRWAAVFHRKLNTGGPAPVSDLDFKETGTNVAPDVSRVSTNRRSQQSAELRREGKAGDGGRCAGRGRAPGSGTATSPRDSDTALSLCCVWLRVL